MVELHKESLRLSWVVESFSFFLACFQWSKIVLIETLERCEWREIDKYIFKREQASLLTQYENRQEKKQRQANYVFKEEHGIVEQALPGLLLKAFLVAED